VRPFFGVNQSYYRGFARSGYRLAHRLAAAVARAREYRLFRRLQPGWEAHRSASADKTARIWDVHFATMSTKGLLAETCAHRLVGISKLSRDDMRLLGYSDDVPEIDVCEGVK
jgi:hypothetical protein